MSCCFTHPVGSENTSWCSQCALFECSEAETYITQSDHAISTQQEWSLQPSRRINRPSLDCCCLLCCAKTASKVLCSSWLFMRFGWAKVIAVRPKPASTKPPCLQGSWIPKGLKHQSASTINSSDSKREGFLVNMMASVSHSSLLIDLSSPPS